MIEFENLDDKVYPFEIGDVYEDCAYHPVWCTDVDYEDGDIAGVSLFDGSRPRSCSIRHCAPRKLTPKEVSFKIQNRQRWLDAESAWRELYTATNMSMTTLLNGNPYDELLNEEYEKFGDKNV